jgi:hypothetical protein
MQVRMRGDLERTQVQLLEDLEEAEVGGRLERHHVARLGDRAQPEHDRLQAAVGDQQLLRIDHRSEPQRVPRDRAAKRFVAGADPVLRERLAMPLRRAGERAPQARLVEQRSVRTGRTERDERGVVDDPHHLGAQRRAIHQPRHRRRMRSLGLGQRPRARRHEVARARPRLDQAGVFERAVGLRGGRQRHAVLARQLAHRRHSLAAAHRAGADRARERLGDLQVQHAAVAQRADRRVGQGLATGESGVVERGVHVCDLCGHDILYWSGDRRQRQMAPESTRTAGSARPLCTRHRCPVASGRGARGRRA